MAQMNLDLLTEAQELNEQLTKVLMILRHQCLWNTDEQLVLGKAVDTQRMLSVALDGVFLRYENFEYPAPIPEDDDTVISLSLIHI